MSGVLFLVLSSGRVFDVKSKSIAIGSITTQIKGEERKGKERSKANQEDTGNMILRGKQLMEREEMLSCG